MTHDESSSNDSALTEVDPLRFAGGNGPVVEYTALPEKPTETVAVAGSHNDDVTAAEAGAFDADD